MRHAIRQPQPGRYTATALLVLILLVAALLRFHDLDRTSVWYDEAVSWSQSAGSFTALLSDVAKDNYPPLHNIVLWLTMPVVGDSETALRLPSAVLGTVAVWLTYLLGAMLGGRPAGLLAAALLAVSPFHIWYSTEARMYALMAATGLAFLLCVLKVLKRPAGIWLAALSISGALFLYSHIYALLGFASVGLVCALLALSDLLRHGKLFSSAATAACLAMGASTAAFLPWLIILANRAQSVAEAGFWIASPDSAFLKTMIFGISGSLALFWTLTALAVLFLIRLLVLRETAATDADWKRRAALVCLAYTAGPPALAYLYSVLVQPILFDRYLIAAWPGLLLLAAAGTQWRLPRLAATALFAVALVLTYRELSFTLQHKVRPDWRGIVQDYDSHRGPGDRLILYKGFAAPALAYYLREEDAFTGAQTVDDIRDITARDPATNRWLLIVHSNPDETEQAGRSGENGQAEEVAQRFGWGASGLKLLRIGPDLKAE